MVGGHSHRDSHWIMADCRSRANARSTAHLAAPNLRSDFLGCFRTCLVRRSRPERTAFQSNWSAISRSRPWQPPACFGSWSGQLAHSCIPAMRRTKHDRLKPTGPGVAPLGGDGIAPARCRHGHGCSRSLLGQRPQRTSHSPRETYRRGLTSLASRAAARHG